jgi:hypothetical protein
MAFDPPALAPRRNLEPCFWFYTHARHSMPTPTPPCASPMLHRWMVARPGCGHGPDLDHALVSRKPRKASLAGPSGGPGRAGRGSR